MHHKNTYILWALKTPTPVKAAVIAAAVVHIQDVVL